MGMLKSVEPTGFLAVCGNKLGGCESADHPKLPARPRTSFVFARLFGSGFASLGFDLRTKGPCLVAAAVNPQGSDVTEGEGRHDRDERLLVELAFLGPSLHASVPTYLP